MKSIINLIVFTVFSSTVFSQISIENDYRLINDIIPQIVDLEKNDTVFLYEETLDFKEKQMFFTKGFLENYKYVPLGKNGNNKLKKLIKKTDFNYFIKQNRPISKWNFEQIKYLKKYELIKFGLINKRKRVGFSLPLFSEDKKTAFLFRENTCNLTECGAYTVTIFKKEKGKWIWYLNIPITLT
jgi:hypothetical protein